MIGDKIREILLDKANSNMNAVTEFLLFLASRAQLVNEVVKPTLLKKNVISDRFILSTLVYQDGVKTEGDMNAVLNFGLQDVQPDLTILLDLPPEESWKRISTIRAMDRMESKGKEAFVERRNKYLNYALLMKNVKIVDANASMDEVYNKVKEAILETTNAK